ncbi:hypothetical protein BGW39_002188 [Mortierella sp. 14UC]|nr:hypothetical protein BGW39_002188 [Mortierella sp. 14UC]
MLPSTPTFTNTSTTANINSYDSSVTHQHPDFNADALSVFTTTNDTNDATALELFPGFGPSGNIISQKDSLLEDHKLQTLVEYATILTLQNQPTYNSIQARLQERLYNYLQSGEQLLDTLGSNASVTTPVAVAIAPPHHDASLDHYYHQLQEKEDLFAEPVDIRTRIPLLDCARTPNLDRLDTPVLSTLGLAGLDFGETTTWSLGLLEGMPLPPGVFLNQPSASAPSTSTVNTDFIAIQISTKRKQSDIALGPAPTIKKHKNVQNQRSIVPSSDKVETTQSTAAPVANNANVGDGVAPAIRLKRKSTEDIAAIPSLTKKARALLVAPLLQTNPSLESTSSSSAPINNQKWLSRSFCPHRCRTHTLNNQKTYQSRDNVFDQQPAARTGGHKRSKSNDKTYVCDHPGCGRSFRRWFNLNSHLNTHNPGTPRPHSCTEPGCNMDFIRKGDLNCQRSVHEPEKGYRDSKFA